MHLQSCCFLTKPIALCCQRRYGRTEPKQRRTVKSSSFRLTKQQLWTRITLFGAFLCRLCLATMWNFLISSFVEYVNIRKGQFSERMLWSFAFTELIRVFTLRKILPVRRVTLPAKPTFGISSKTVRTSFVRNCRKSCLARPGELDAGRRVTLLPGASRI